jgi:NADH dehydrogenase
MSEATGVTVRVQTQRRAALGFGCGVICSLVVWPFAHPLALWVLLLGGATGAAFAALVPRENGGWLDDAFTAGALALPFWLLLEIIVLPLAGGGQPAWSAAGLRGAFGALAGWLFFGLMLGVVVNRVFAAAHVALTPLPDAPPAAKPERVLILGGGFAGVATALNLEKLLGADPTFEITLVSDANALLFTPMLAEVAGSSIEPTHISTPLRASLRRTRVLRGRVAAIDLDERRVSLQPETIQGIPRRLEYDHLVLALGSVSNFFGQSNIERIAHDFKSLTDAIRIRNAVIANFERADRESDPGIRRRLLTFVVAGGGFAGVELAGALNDYARGMLAEYPDLEPQDVRVIVVHARERILPELGPELAAYALAKMSERGVQFKLKTRVRDASATAVFLDPPEEISAETLVWTAGTEPNRLLATLAVQRDQRGAVLVDATLAVAGRAGLWALGDCASIPDLVAGGTLPPTAQYALREAETLAHNIRSAVRGAALRKFRFAGIGALCVIGHQTACAELRIPLAGRNVHFSGLFAWLMWRIVYLAKLPGFDRKVRVLIDWVIELYFPRDTVQTIELS